MWQAVGWICVLIASGIHFPALRPAALIELWGGILNRLRRPFLLTLFCVSLNTGWRFFPNIPVHCCGDQNLTLLMAFQVAHAIGSTVTHVTASGKTGKVFNRCV
jgi:hypothetical protein